MGEKARASTAGWRGRLLAAVLLCAGYALYSSAAYGGALDTALMAALGLDEAAMLLAHTLLMAGSGVGCMTARALAAHGVDLLRMPVCAACYGAVGACLVVAFLLASAPAAVCLLSLMMGLATAVPLLLWFEAFLVAYRSWGPSACLALIAVATLAGRFLGAFSGVVVRSVALALGAAVACTAIAGICQGVFLRRNPAGGGRFEEGSAGLPPAGTYRLSVYMVTLVACFGVTAGLASSAAQLGMSAVPGLGAGWGGAAAAVACGAVAAYAGLGARGRGPHFGQFIRLSLVFSGVAFAFAPLLSLQALPLLVLLCQAAGIVAGIAMTLLSIEISYERRLRIVDVMSLNYIVYVVFTCVAMEVPALFADFADNTVAWSVVSAIAVTATVAVIPVLPSSTSTAATFTYKELPENESYEARTARRRGDVAVKYGLSARETEVFELLVQGLTRGQIAERLSLSSWTVKEYIAGVYAKVGVHSAKELMILVAGGERGRR